MLSRVPRIWGASIMPSSSFLQKINQINCISFPSLHPCTQDKTIKSLVPNGFGLASFIARWYLRKHRRSLYNQWKITENKRVVKMSPGALTIGIQKPISTIYVGALALSSSCWLLIWSAFWWLKIRVFTQDVYIQQRRDFEWRKASRYLSPALFTARRYTTLSGGSCSFLLTFNQSFCLYLVSHNPWL